MSHYKGGGAGPKHGLTKYSDLPNMLAVPLKAGQTIFWEGDLIHRGSMKPGVERCTLHCSMGVAGKPAPDRKPTACDKRMIWQTHTDVREALPREWQKRAWDVWRAGQLVDEDVERWHRRPSTEQPQIDFAVETAEAVV